MTDKVKEDRNRYTTLKSRLDNIRHTRRVLAPYIKAKKRIHIQTEENKYYTYYAEKKPSILLQVMTKWGIALDLKEILMETITTLKHATDSTDGIVFLMDDNLEEIFYMTQDTLFEHDLKVSYKIETGTTVAAFVAFTKMCLKIPDLLEDTRFPQGLGQPDVEVKSVICVPVVTPEDEVLAVFLLSRQLNDDEYTDVDFILTIMMASWVGSSLHQHQVQFTLKKQQELNTYLLNLIQVYLCDTTIFDKMMRDILNLCTVTTDADHSAIYILLNHGTSVRDKNYASATIYEQGGKFASDDSIYKMKIEIDMDDENSLLRQCILNQKLINKKDCILRNSLSAADLYHKKVYRLRTVLAIPIKCGMSIVGILMVTNKRRVSMFLKPDEIILNTFAEYCGLAVKYARVNEEKINYENLNKTYSDMLSYHIQPCVHDKYTYESRGTYLALPPRFNTFDFYYQSELGNDIMPDLAAYILQQTIEDLFISENQIMMFVLSVRKYCKENPYHNFEHSFHALHCVYVTLRTTSPPFTQTQIQGMLLGAFCHCISHPAMSNSMIQIQDHFLSDVYEEPVVENYSFGITQFLIEFEVNEYCIKVFKIRKHFTSIKRQDLYNDLPKKMKLFTHLATEDYDKLLKQIKYCIIATNISVYMERKREVTKLYNSAQFDVNIPSHCDLMISMIMAMSSLADMCKPFTVTSFLVSQMYEEMYNEGDYYKTVGLCPTRFYNRDETSFMPEDQIDFMSMVVIPCALVLYKMLPSVDPLYQESKTVKTHWVEIQESKGQRMWTVADSHPHKFINELGLSPSKVKFDD